MRVRTALLAATAAALLVPAASQAATLGMEGNTLVYRGEGSEGINLLLTDYEDWETGKTFLRFYDSGTDHVQINTSLCQDHEYGGIICERDPNRPIRIEGCERQGHLRSSATTAVPDSIPVTINGNGGDDRIKDAYDGSAGRTLNGGAGNDEINGYAGNDAIDGGDGNDKLDGGEGNDARARRRGRRPGRRRRLQDAGRRPRSTAARATTTSTAGATRSSCSASPRSTSRSTAWPTTAAPVRTTTSSASRTSRCTSSARSRAPTAREKIVIANPGNSGPSTLIGRGGDDELVGHDFNDNVDGGNGNDHVEGGLGNDTVTGGPGQDTIYGDATAARCTIYACKISFGNDVINARDGEVDNIDCGIGQDKAIVDAIDVVANCETVDGAGSGGGGGQGGGGKRRVPVHASARPSSPRSPRA